MKRIFSFCTLLLIAGSRVILAQPPTGNAPKAPNPGNVGGVAAQTPAEIAAEEKRILAGRAEALKTFAAISAKLDAMTPEQDLEAMRIQNEPLLRQRFNQAGFKDLALQDTVLDFVAAQEKSRRPVREAAAKVYLVLRTKTSVDADLSSATTALASAVEAAQAGRETATQALDAAIHFSANPHLEAVLTLNGLIGEASFLTSELSELQAQSAGGVLPYLPRTRAAAAPDAATLSPEQKAKQEKEYLEGYLYGQNMVRAMTKMSPAQVQEQKRNTNERLLRRNLTSYGVADPETQNAIVKFVAAQEKSRDAVREAARAVYLSIAPQGEPVSQANMSARLGKYLAATERAKTERETAIQALDQAIGLSATPRLVARLSLRGLVGESSWFTGYVLPTGALSIEVLL